MTNDMNTTPPKSLDILSDSKAIQLSQTYDENSGNFLDNANVAVSKGTRRQVLLERNVESTVSKLNVVSSPAHGGIQNISCLTKGSIHKEGNKCINREVHPKVPVVFNNLHVPQKAVEPNSEELSTSGDNACAVQIKMTNDSDNFCWLKSPTVSTVMPRDLRRRPAHPLRLNATGFPPIGKKRGFSIFANNALHIPQRIAESEEFKSTSPKRKPVKSMINNEFYNLNLSTTPVAKANGENSQKPKPALSPLNVFYLDEDTKTKSVRRVSQRILKRNQNCPSMVDATKSTPSDNSLNRKNLPMNLKLQTTDQNVQIKNIEYVNPMFGIDAIDDNQVPSSSPSIDKTFEVDNEYATERRRSTHSPNIQTISPVTSSTTNEVVTKEQSTILENDVSKTYQEDRDDTVESVPTEVGALEMFQPGQLKKRKYAPRITSADYQFVNAVKGFKDEDDYEKCLLNIHLANHSRGILKDAYHTDIIQRATTCGMTKTFLEYSRDQKLCVVCKKPKKNKKDPIQKCSYAHPDNPSCKRFVHTACAPKMNLGGYLVFQATTLQGFCCPEHHCTQCFSLGWHKPAFTTDDSLISCFSCASKYHAQCIPAGCYVQTSPTGKKFIICPRHYKKRILSHLEKCFECEDALKNRDKPLIKCSNCPKCFHAKCHSVCSYKPGSTFGERCSICFLHRFATVSEYVIVQYRSNRYHLGLVVSHDELRPPRKLHPGFCVVKFILEREVPLLYTISHYDLFFVKENTMFSRYEFVSKMPELRKTTFCSIIENFLFLLKTTPKSVQKFVNSAMLRNNLLKFTDRNTCQIGNPRNRVGDRAIDACTCVTVEGSKRCFFETCGNHKLQIECPPSCDLKGNCQNRFITKKQGICDQKQAEVFATEHGYYGLKALIDLEKNSYIGEYCGEVISDEHVTDSYRYKRIWNSSDSGMYFMQVEDKYIDAEYYGSMVRFMNHSCNPNCRAIIFDSVTGFHVCLFTLREIKANEELTFSYTDNKCRTGRNKVKCFCKDVRCSGFMWM